MRLGLDRRPIEPSASSLSGERRAEHAAVDAAARRKAVRRRWTRRRLGTSHFPLLAGADDGPSERTAGPAYAARNQFAYKSIVAHKNGPAGRVVRRLEGRPFRVGVRACTFAHKRCFTARIGMGRCRAPNVGPARFGICPREHGGRRQGFGRQKVMPSADAEPPAVSSGMCGPRQTDGFWGRDRVARQDRSLALAYRRRRDLPSPCQRPRRRYARRFDGT
jgi:hypothetical protein